MNRLKFLIRKLRFSTGHLRMAAVIVLVIGAFTGALLLTPDVLARVGGGQSYGGGSRGGGSGGGDGGGALIYLVLRFLLWLTIEHPAIGIPIDIVVITIVIYWFTRKKREDISVTSASPLDVVTTAMQQGDVQHSFIKL